jgi:cytochrome P450
MRDALRFAVDTRGKALPVIDYAGFAPFGFGYRRCPGEQLTIQVFEDFPAEGVEGQN